MLYQQWWCLQDCNTMFCETMRRIILRQPTTYVVGCRNYTPHSCLPPLSLCKPVEKGVASPHYVCVFEIFGKGGRSVCSVCEGVAWRCFQFSQNMVRHDCDIRFPSNWRCWENPQARCWLCCAHCSTPSHHLSLLLAYWKLHNWTIKTKFSEIIHL